MPPGPQPQRRPLNRQDSQVAQQMVERAAELARDSHARTRHAAVLMSEGSLLGWGTNGVPFPGEDHCYCKVAEHGNHDHCRTHAEQRAISLAREGEGWRKLQDAKLVYVRLAPDDSVRLEDPALLRPLPPARPVPRRGRVDLRPLRGPGRLLRHRLRHDFPAQMVSCCLRMSGLSSSAGRRVPGQWRADRARIILACAEGISNAAAARELGVAVKSVSKWRRQFAAERLAGLENAAPVGRRKRNWC